MSDALPVDTNMAPGQTYTFKLKLENWVTDPSPSTIQADIGSNAPAFLANIQVTQEATANPLKNYFDIEINYTGDGSDVISDVANSIVSSIKQGSNDNFSFDSAYQDFAANVGSTSVADVTKQTISSIGGTIGDALQKATQSVTDTAAKGAQNLLTPIEIALIVVVGLVVLIIFTSGKAGGLSASESGLNIGGR